jgi:hypothetical protein
MTPRRSTSAEGLGVAESVYQSKTPVLTRIRTVELAAGQTLVLMYTPAGMLLSVRTRSKEVPQDQLPVEASPASDRTRFMFPTAFQSPIMADVGALKRSGQAFGAL